MIFIFTIFLIKHYYCLKMSFLNKINYYLNASYRRKALDKLQEQNKNLYQGIILDIGGRDRGKFRKPKEQVDKWIFADIEEKHNPDIVLDITNMHNIEIGSIDIINTMEIFEHVDKPVKALKECYRILKNTGIIIISCPFMFPIHADPYDFQRWTDVKWQNELKEAGFKLEKFIIEGRFFTVYADMYKYLIKTFPFFLRYPLYLTYPIIDLFVKLDKTEFIIKHKKLGKYHSGYFLIARK